MRQTASGFSTVELLIAIFIATLFLFAGHQLYAAVVKDSGFARQRATASGIASGYLDRYAASAPSICADSTVLDRVEITPAPALVNAKVLLVYNCPDSSLPTLTKVTATVSYDYKGEKEVKHVRYVSP